MVSNLAPLICFISDMYHIRPLADGSITHKWAKDDHNSSRRHTSSILSSLEHLHLW